MKYNLTGYNIDNLLKTLYLKKFSLSNIERKGHNVVSFEIPDNQAKKVKKYITNFKGQQIAGFFKRLPKLILTNISLLIAVFVGALFFAFSSNYIWQIRIFGTKDLDPNEIISLLEQNGVKKGKLNLKSTEEIETILLENYNRLAQVSVIKQGSAIIINLSEKLVYTQQTYQAITAKYSGIITKINIITGTTNIKVGDYVNVGDSLVLPFNLDKDGNKISVNPMAEIEAKMFVMGSAKLDKNGTILTRTGNKQIVYDYFIFNKHIFSGKNKNSFALFENVSYNNFVSDVLPLVRRTTEFYELKLTPITYDFEAEKQALIEQSRQNAVEALPAEYLEIETAQKTEIVGETMYAYTTYTIKGRING